MGKDKKEFSESTRSKLDLLYSSVADIPSRDPHVILADRVFTKQEIFKKMTDQPFVQTMQKHATLESHSITPTDVIKAIKSINSVKTSSTTNLFAEFINVGHLPRVKFWSAQMRDGKFYPTRMLIDLTGIEIPSNCSVRINTGYIAKIPFIARTRTLVNNKIEIGARQKQPDFVIVPVFSCKTAHIVPSICARDPDDTGLITLNFTLISGTVDKIQVIFNAYATSRPLTSIKLVEPEPNAEIFKPKDSRCGRLVKNPKVKMHFDRMTIDKADNSAVFPTYNSLLKPIATYEKQEVRISSQNAILVSRKREWCKKELLTLVGYYDATGTSTVCPKVLGENYNKNTHCIVFVASKNTLFSELVTETHDLKILNGAFADLPNYTEISKSIKQVLNGTNGLNVGFDSCSMQAKRFTDISLNSLLRIYDYHRYISNKEQDLREQVELSEEQLFNSRPVDNNAYSVSLYKPMLHLIAEFYDKELTAQQREALKSSGVLERKREERQTSMASPTTSVRDAPKKRACERMVEESSPVDDARDIKHVAASSGDDDDANHVVSSSAKRQKSL